MMKIGLIGFGKTGKLAAREFILDNSVELAWVVKNSSNLNGQYASSILAMDGLEGEIFSKAVFENPERFIRHHPADVLIDFSNKLSVNDYSRLAGMGIKIVSAISNYDQRELELMEDMSQNTAILLSPNITLGINFLLFMAKYLNKILKDVDIEIVEEHYSGKKGPSGTALKIADELGLDKEKQVKSIRAGGIVGKHQIIFGLPKQTIRLTHETHDRGAFGQGALFAAKWITGKKTGLYRMEDIVKSEILGYALQSTT